MRCARLLGLTADTGAAGQAGAGGRGGEGNLGLRAAGRSRRREEADDIIAALGFGLDVVHHHNTHLRICALGGRRRVTLLDDERRWRAGRRGRKRRKTAEDGRAAAEERMESWAEPGRAPGLRAWPASRSSSLGYGNAQVFGWPFPTLELPSFPLPPPFAALASPSLASPRVRPPIVSVP